MKLYKCTFSDDEEGSLLSWHSSRAAAQRDLRSQQRERGSAANGPEGVEVEIVPTDKAGLIRWLNIKFTRDNN